MDNTLFDLQNSSYPTQPRSIIANYLAMSCTFQEVHTLNETSTCQTGLAVCGTIQIFPLDGNWTLDLIETVASVHTQKHTLKISEKQ